MASHTATPPGKVWDIFIRLFHWSLVITIGLAWWTAEAGHMEWHKKLGFLLLSLILFRLIWGVIGSHYARFGEFIASPPKTLRYFSALLRHKPPHYVGHNPLGGWMVVAILVLCLVQGTTGLFATDDIFTTGPLYPYISDDLAGTLTSIHKLTFTLIQIAVVLHVLAVLFHQIFHRDRLIEAMIHGRKPLGENQPVATLSWPRALISLIFSAGLFFLLLSLN